MVTREEFIREVKEFKKIHGKKLKELLNENSCCQLYMSSHPDLGEAKNVNQRPKLIPFQRAKVTPLSRFI